MALTPDQVKQLQQLRQEDPAEYSAMLTRMSEDGDPQFLEIVKQIGDAPVREGTIEGARDNGVLTPPPAIVDGDSPQLKLAKQQAATAFEAARRALQAQEELFAGEGELDPFTAFNVQQAFASYAQALGAVRSEIRSPEEKRELKLKIELLEQRVAAGQQPGLPQETDAQRELREAQAGEAVARTGEIEAGLEAKLARQKILAKFSKDYNERLQALQGISGEELATALDALRLEFSGLLEDPEMFIKTVDSLIEREITKRKDAAERARTTTGAETERLGVAQRAVQEYFGGFGAATDMQVGALRGLTQGIGKERTAQMLGVQPNNPAVFALGKLIKELGKGADEGVSPEATQPAAVSAQPAVAGTDPAAAAEADGFFGLGPGQNIQPDRMTQPPADGFFGLGPGQNIQPDRMTPANSSQPGVPGPVGPMRDVSSNLARGGGKPPEDEDKITIERKPAGGGTEKWTYNKKTPGGARGGGNPFMGMFPQAGAEQPPMAPKDGLRQLLKLIDDKRTPSIVA